MKLPGSTLALVVAFGVTGVMASAAADSMERYSRRSERNTRRSTFAPDIARSPQQAKPPLILRGARLVQPSRSAATLSSSAVLPPVTAKFDVAGGVSRPDAREVQMDRSHQPMLLAPALRRPGMALNYDRRFSMSPAVTITRPAASGRAEASSPDRSGAHVDTSRTERASATGAGIDAPVRADELR